MPKLIRLRTGMTVRTERSQHAQHKLIQQVFEELSKRHGVPPNGDGSEINRLSGMPLRLVRATRWNTPGHGMRGNVQLTVFMAEHIRPYIKTVAKTWAENHASLGIPLDAQRIADALAAPRGTKIWDEVVVMPLERGLAVAHTRGSYGESRLLKLAIVQSKRARIDHHAAVEKALTTYFDAIESHVGENAVFTNAKFVAHTDPTRRVLILHGLDIPMGQLADRKDLSRQVTFLEASAQYSRDIEKVLVNAGFKFPKKIRDDKSELPNTVRNDQTHVFLPVPHVDKPRLIEFLSKRGLIIDK